MSPLPDPIPLPPDLAVDDPPISDEALVSLDVAFESAARDGIEDPTDIALDPGGDESDWPSAAYLVPDEVREFSISDDSLAEWAMRHLAEIDTELADLTARREDWQRRIDAWFQSGSIRLIRRRAFFIAHLTAYWSRRRSENPKGAKTLSLPSGRITSSDRQASVKVVDDEALAAWLKTQDLLTDDEGAEIVATTTKVYAVPLRRVLKPAGDGLVIVPTGEPLKPGELPDGLQIEPAHTTFDVKPVLG